MEDKKNSIHRALDDALLNIGGGLGGMAIGQSLDGPIQQLAKDIQLRKFRVNNELHGEKVTDIFGKHPSKQKSADKAFRKKRLKGYIPTPGIPKSKASLVGGAVGSYTLPIIVSAIKEERESKEVVDNLEKEAYETYTSLPQIKGPRNFF